MPGDTHRVVHAYRVDLVMRYTRISCMPFKAKFPASKLVQALDEQDAVRQACLCLDRDLEDVLAGVNAINVSEVRVEFSRVELVRGTGAEYWNPEWFEGGIPIPEHVIVR